MNQTGDLRGPERMEQVEKVRTDAGEKLLAALTPEQQDRWKELIGEPFKGEIRFGPPPGGPGGRQPGGKGRDPGQEAKSK